MTDADLSAIFNRHAFDPWHPHNRERNCLYVLNYAAFQEAAREAIAAKTRTLVDALRPLAAISCKCHEGYPASVSLWDRITDCDCRAWKSATLGDIREAARLVAEYDAAQQKGPTP